MSTIYGIYYSNKCWYVGSTEREVEDRWKEHIRELEKGKHTNKTLQKYYNTNCKSIEELEFKVLYTLDTDNSLIRYFTEMLSISLYKPICNKCVVQTGQSRVVFARCKQDIAKKLLDVIVESNL